MKELPESLNVAALLALSLPGDITLDVVRSHFMASDVAKAIGEKLQPHKGRVLRIRFILETEPETELPDHTTLEEFQDLARRGLAYISVDDLGGGLPAAREPEVVG